MNFFEKIFEFLDFLVTLIPRLMSILIDLVHSFVEMFSLIPAPFLTLLTVAIVIFIFRLLANLL